MVLFWFLLALVLLVAALIILRLDAKQRRSRAGGQRPAVQQGRPRSSSEGLEAGTGQVNAEGDEPQQADNASNADKADSAGQTDQADNADEAGSAGALGKTTNQDDDDNSSAHPTPSTGDSGAADESTGTTTTPSEPGAPMLAPFQRADGDQSGGGVSAAGLAGGAAAAGAVAAGVGAVAAGKTDKSDKTDKAEKAEKKAEKEAEKKAARSAAKQAAADASAADAAAQADAAAHAAADDEALAAASASQSDAAASGPAPSGPEFSDHATSDPAPLDPAEPTVESSPRLLDRVRALLPARRTTARPAEQVEPEPADPLAGSPVVRWLEDREFAPTPTPAPEFRHGDFAGGLSALGTVSHGVFRGRRAIMGVTGGRTVLALRRDTASDVVLDLSRPDVDSEPGFHDAGDVGVLEARTSDYGRLDLVDRDRLIDAIRDVPADVRRIWAEGEWVAATIDGVDDPTGWDDVVMALHGAADVVAPFPPIGGRARALPSELDPGAPAAADGPQADPTMGMDGEVGTGTHGNGPLPDPEDLVVVDDSSDPTATTVPARPTAGTGPVGVAAPGADSGDGSASGFLAAGEVGTAGAAGAAAAATRKGGHLRLVPDRPAARDLSDRPVVADRGDVVDGTDAGASAEAGAPAGDETAIPQPTGEVPEVEGSDVEAPAAEEPAVEEPDPFAEVMKPSGPIESRGDVAADHLEPRPPLARPTRGVGQAYPEDASVPPLAAGVATGGAGIKPLGSEDNEDEIRDEVERFDAARIDGGSDFDGSSGRHGSEASGSEASGSNESGSDGSGSGEGTSGTGRSDSQDANEPAADESASEQRGSGGKHGADDLDPSEVTQKLSVAELAERMGIDPSEMRSSGRRRRRAEPEDEKAEDEKADGGAEESSQSSEASNPAPGRERPGIEPDVERTTRLHLPPDIRE